MQANSFILQLPKPRLSSWNPPQSSNRTTAGQGLTPRVPLLASHFFHQTGCGSLTPPPKVLRKFPPSVCQGRVGRVCGLERTGKTTYSDSQHEAWRGDVCGVGCDGWMKTPGPLPGRPGCSGERTLRLRLGEPPDYLLVYFPCAVSAWGRPAWRVPHYRTDCAFSGPEWANCCPCPASAVFGGLGGIFQSSSFLPPPEAAGVWGGCSCFYFAIPPPLPPGSLISSCALSPHLFKPSLNLSR